MTEDHTRRVPDQELDFDEHGRALYKGELYSGVAWESPSGDKHMSEVSYFRGLRHGVAVDWYSESRIAARQDFRYGAKHGEEVEWFPDGSRCLEATWENDLRVRMRRWAQDGSTMVEEWELPVDDPRRQLARDLQAGVQRIGAKADDSEEA